MVLEAGFSVFDIVAKWPNARKIWRMLHTIGNYVYVHRLAFCYVSPVHLFCEVKIWFYFSLVGHNVTFNY